MPRVGSSRISRSGSGNIHLPSSTFCWLPPESLTTPSVTEFALTFSALRYRSAARYAASGSITERLEMRRRSAATTVSWMVSSRLRPSALRSSGT